MVDASVSHMWAIGGSRKTLSRVSHLLCEMFTRLQMVGLAKVGQSLPYVVNQRDLSDALGLSLVHTNKTLAVLKNKTIIRLSGMKIEILDWERLADIAEFDPAYLHLKTPH